VSVEEYLFNAGFPSRVASSARCGKERKRGSSGSRCFSRLRGSIVIDNCMGRVCKCSTISGWNSQDRAREVKVNWNLAVNASLIRKSEARLKLRDDDDIKDSLGRYQEPSEPTPSCDGP
jgi:hypothetical protein